MGSRDGSGKVTRLVNNVASSGRENVSDEDASDEDVPDEDASDKDALFDAWSALSRVFIRRGCHLVAADDVPKPLGSSSECSMTDQPQQLLLLLDATHHRAVEILTFVDSGVGTFGRRTGRRYC